QPVSQRVIIEGAEADALAGTYTFSTSYYIDGSVAGKSWSAYGGLDSESVVYERDQLSRITTVYGGTGETYATNIFYEPAGLLSSAQYPTSTAVIEQTYTYNEANRLDHVWTEALDRAGTLANVTYDYDDAGNVLS